MSLIPCPYCGHQVADQESGTCPQCGGHYIGGMAAAMQQQRLKEEARKAERAKEKARAKEAKEIIAEKEFYENQKKNKLLNTLIAIPAWGGLTGVCLYALLTKDCGSAGDEALGWVCTAIPFAFFVLSIWGSYGKYK